MIQTFQINIISLIDLLILLQGLIIGFSLLLKNNTQRPSIFFGLFLITYSLELLTTILGDSNWINEVPKLLFLPLNFYFLSFTLLYFYCITIISNKHWSSKIYQLIPGLIEFLIFLTLFLLPVETKKTLFNHVNYSGIYSIYFTMGCLYSVYYTIKIIRITKQHKNEVLNYFSHTEDRLLTWVRNGSIAILIMLCSYFLFLILPLKDLYIPYFIVSLFNLIIIYYFSIKAIKQVYVKIKKEESSDQNNQISKENLNKYIKESKIFLDSNLTILELSKKIGIPPKQLSSIINKTYPNFNSFINWYRIDAAKSFLTNEEKSNLSIEGIGYEVGFKSKSAFYRAFKEFEKTTPGSFTY